MTQPVFGDAEAAIVDILSTDIEVGQFDPIVSTDLVGLDEGPRWIRVTRTGGVPVMWMWLDNPTIRIEVSAELKSVAFDLASAVRRAIYAARGTYSGNGLLLYDVGDADGLEWTPDDARPELARYAFTLSLLTRPGG